MKAVTRWFWIWALLPPLAALRAADTAAPPPLAPPIPMAPAEAEPDADEAPPAGPLPDYRVTEPQGPWRADHWPVVVVLTPPATDPAPVAQAYARLTRSRGALLLVCPGGDLPTLRRILERVALDYPTRPGLLLAARDQLADWARDLALAMPEQVTGLISINAPVETLPRAPAGRVAFRAVLLVLNPDLYDANDRLLQKLLAVGVPSALRQIQVVEVNRYVNAALDHLLPPPPSQTTLYDPVTKARLDGVPGWEFIRDDFLFAIARPTDHPAGPRIEVATGLLGERSFEGYVAATSEALQVDGIELLESGRITPPDAPFMAQAFYFIDRREGERQAVYWVQVGAGSRIVSFRSVGTPEELTARLDQIRQLALAVQFDAPAP